MLMDSEKAITIEGTIMSVLPGTMFRVALANDHLVLDTGRTIEEKCWATAKLKKQKLTCEHCGGVHTWEKQDVILGRYQ